METLRLTSAIHEFKNLLFLIVFSALIFHSETSKGQDSIENIHKKTIKEFIECMQKGQIKMNIYIHYFGIENESERFAEEKICHERFLSTDSCRNLILSSHKYPDLFDSYYLRMLENKIKNLKIKNTSIFKIDKDCYNYIVRFETSRNKSVMLFFTLSSARGKEHLIGNILDENMKTIF